jgi:hypothetical protein
LTFFVFGSYFWSQIIQQTFFFGWISIHSLVDFCIYLITHVKSLFANLIIFS